MEDFLIGVAGGAAGMHLLRSLLAAVRQRLRRRGADSDRTSGLRRYQRMKQGK